MIFDQVEFDDHEQVVFCRHKASGLKAIISVQQEGINPALYARLHCCQLTSAAVERSFSMLSKLLRKDRPFFSANVNKYLCLHYNKF